MTEKRRTAEFEEALAYLQRLDKGGWSCEFDQMDVAAFVDGYLRNPIYQLNPIRLEIDDPIDHLAHFMHIAYDMGGAVAINPECLDVDFPPGTKDWIRWVFFAGRYLNAINPSFTSAEWAQLFYAVLRRLRGGEFVRIRKRPKLAKLLDAQFMDADRLIAKYGISRRHAFNLRKEAVEIRRKRAREK